MCPINGGRKVVKRNLVNACSEPKSLHIVLTPLPYPFNRVTTLRFKGRLSNSPSCAAKSDSDRQQTQVLICEKIAVLLHLKIHT